MTAPARDDGADGWDAAFRPERTTKIAYLVAAFIALTGIVVAFFNRRAFGATWRGVDQIAIGGLALVLAASVLLLTRPRLKIGPSGLAVRNVLDYQLIPWTEVVDISFPRGKRFARIDLDYDEYIPVLAIQAADGERAVKAMDTVRALMDRYRPD